MMAVVSEECHRESRLGRSLASAGAGAGASFPSIDDDQFSKYSVIACIYLLTAD